ncbi:hypothetical protein EMIHUDRAFT_427681 [Emiliania huxleyi CCMP1516]|uniref:FAD-binding PCMH-type domain-containing protein n=2 Tax=Emiliania huxleyi TaxID=2903 RepID=A0A0D3ISU7_EMIH1|nr:hypothetical protein EMIHUDRAFT_427681 [Emiliania huxleyi CCMP1516]EOD14332.1 hypothetical protein EMIHUDRAFT_427681 [Emiliania huxleyi CCMP1516]|eukprot:XP_005766761.1 hypothetical protein EMIHUDRAFT_427681 [Emiliania huxleyi CCMP1516]
MNERYSPLLKPQLTGRVADALVLATSEADVVASLAAAVRHRVFVTTRGAGTGNYGQAAPPPSSSALCDLEPPLYFLFASCVSFFIGVKLCDLEDHARQHGWELRQHPSTRRTASVGGFVAGGSTGHGALLHGGLSEAGAPLGSDGAVLGLRVVTAEDQTPRVLELSGRDVFPVVHAYGTNGVITSVELPLARAQAWSDVTAAFPSLDAAAAFALDVANAPAVVKRGISVFQAPIAHNAHGRDGAMAAGGDARHVAMVQCSPPGVGPVERLCAEHGGLTTRVVKATEAPRPMYEFGWNHTTLHALRADKSVTYLQCVLEPSSALGLLRRVSEEFDPSELLQHLEVVNFGGRAGFASLALLWPKGETGEAANQRLREILSWHEANGIPVFDPHTHVLEDGGMKVTDWAQLGFKRRVDPHGLLNPGKMRAWEEQSATADTSDPRGAFAASYRIADTSAVGSGPNVATSATAADASSTAADSFGTHASSPGSGRRRPRSRLWGEWSTADFAEADLSQAVR